MKNTNPISITLPNLHKAGLDRLCNWYGYLVMDKQFKLKLNKLKRYSDKRFAFLKECENEYYRLYGKYPDGDCWVDTFNGGSAVILDFKSLENEARAKNY